LAAGAPKVCPAASDPLLVDLGGLRLVVVDSADTEDAAAPPALVSAFAASLAAAIDHSDATPAWIVTHRPIWDASRAGDTLSDGVVNATERAAVKARDLGGVRLVLSGHVHNFTSLDFASSRPPQLIVGAGGDLMEANDRPSPVSGAVTVDGQPAKAFTMGRFGYFEFDRHGQDWVGAFHDLDDRVVAACRLHRRSLSCVSPAAGLSTE
jgi:hypothetical protein